MSVVPTFVEAKRTPLSRRVRLLFAALLKALVQREYGYEMREGEALDLSQYGSLADAMDAVRSRLDINRQFPDSMLRTSLAVQEASILASRPADDEYALAQILKARRTAFELLSAKKDAIRRDHQLSASLRQRLVQIKSWGRNYSQFVSRMEQLYLNAELQLRLLNLREETFRAAVRDLEKLFDAALGI